MKFEIKYAIFIYVIEMALKKGFKGGYYNISNLCFIIN